MLYFCPTACENIRCKKGSQCKVDELTGWPYCQPSCDLSNGGCAANETCSLRKVICFRAPCPPVVECTPSELNITVGLSIGSYIAT